MVIHQLACLADHLVDERFGPLGILVASQKSEFTCCQAVFSITPSGAPEVQAFRDSSGHEYLNRVLDLAVATYREWVFTTNMTQSVTIRNYRDV